jgi:hypothetical protein
MCQHAGEISETFPPRTVVGKIWGQSGGAVHLFRVEFFGETSVSGHNREPFWSRTARFECFRFNLRHGLIYIYNVNL